MNAEAKYVNNILCVPSTWLTEAYSIVLNGKTVEMPALMTYEAYKKKRTRKQLKSEGHPAPDRPAMIHYQTLDESIKKQIELRVGGRLEDVVKRSYLESKIVPDSEAARFFVNYLKPDGKNLKPEEQTRLLSEACILNAVLEILKDERGVRKALGTNRGGLWEKISTAINNLNREKFPHKLPTHVTSLKRVVADYKTSSYASLLHGNTGNEHSRKVNSDLEKLLISLKTMPHKPYDTDVLNMYYQFIGGALEVVDRNTGEIFQPAQFRDKQGNPILLSESTVWAYMNKPKNKRLIDALTMSTHDFNSQHRPHHFRAKPYYALSMLSWDDRDLQESLGGRLHVKAYYAYDAASTALIGWAHALKKDETLLLNCIRNTFRNLYTFGLAMPAEVQVENYLVSEFRDTIFKAQTLFQFVRFCAPGNSQEKYAEHFNRQLKYGISKKDRAHVGRFYAKLPENKPNKERVNTPDSNNDDYMQKVYTFDECVALDLRDIEDYNKEMHPDQKLYRGMTRLDVLLNNANPRLEAFNEPLVMYYIGNKTQTSIRRNQYLALNNAFYMLSKPEAIDMLSPNNYSVDAYWLPNDKGEVDKAYIYQNNQLIDCVSRIDRYQVAQIERTPMDDELELNQNKFISQFDSLVRKEKNEMPRVAVSPKVDRTATKPAKTVRTDVEPQRKQAEVINYSSRAFDEI